MPPPLPRIARPASLSEEVFLALEGRIRAAEFRPGGRLPTEKQLSALFGVSRAVVREAVARLRADGYVETRQGAGAYVCGQPGKASFRLPAERLHEAAARVVKAAARVSRRLGYPGDFPE